MFREAWTAVILWLRATVATIVASVIQVPAALRPLLQTARDLPRPFCETMVSPEGHSVLMRSRKFVCKSTQMIKRFSS